MTRASRWSASTIEWARERAGMDKGGEGMAGRLGRRAQESKAKGEGSGGVKEGNSSTVRECVRNVAEEGRGCVAWTGSCSGGMREGVSMSYKNKK